MGYTSSDNYFTCSFNFERLLVFLQCINCQRIFQSNLLWIEEANVENDSTDSGSCCTCKEKMFGVYQGMKEYYDALDDETKYL